MGPYGNFVVATPECFVGLATSTLCSPFVSGNFLFLCISINAIFMAQKVQTGFISFDMDEGGSVWSYYLVSAIAPYIYKVD